MLKVRSGGPLLHPHSSFRRRRHVELVLLFATDNSDDNEENGDPDKPMDATNPIIRFFENLIIPKWSKDGPDYPSFPAGTDDIGDSRSAKMETAGTSKRRQTNTTNPIATFFDNILKTKEKSRLPYPSFPSHTDDSPPLKRAPKNHQQNEPLHQFARGITRFFQRLFYRNATTTETSHLMNDTTPDVAVDVNTTSLAANSWDSPGNTFDEPPGPRWAIPARTTDLSGTWRPVITPAFKKEYEKYLENLGQSFAFRTLCLNFVGLTRETITQDGTLLNIRGTTPIGVWDRTLVSSGSNLTNAEYEPFNVTFLDPDKDLVDVEAWWEDGGTVHKSWLRGKPRVNGGEFESTRYLENNNTLICESLFHPPNGTKANSFRPAFVKWRFEREK
jgi:hypothetical protein